MSEFTIGELATALGGIIESLNGIAEELGQCDQAAEIVSTEGWSALCSIPPAHRRGVRSSGQGAVRRRRPGRDRRGYQGLDRRRSVETWQLRPRDAC